MTMRADRYMELLDDAVGTQDFERLMSIRTDIVDDRELDDEARAWLVGTATTYAGDVAQALMTPEEQARAQMGVLTDMQRRAFGEDVTDEQLSEVPAGSNGSGPAEA